MMRMLGLSLAALFLTSLMAAAEETTPYYPLKVGSKWTYKVTGGSIEVKVEKKETVGNEETYRLETTSQGKISATENVVVRGGDKDAAGVYRVAVNSLKPDQAIRFLALPPTKGTKWDVKTKVSGQEVDGTFVIKEEDVAVKFGSFKGAILVEGTNFKIANQETTIKCWFVKDVGIVKLEFKLGGQDATLELETYEAGK